MQIVQYSTPELIQITDDFTDELERASKGKQSFLSFIPYPLPTHIAKHDRFHVVVMGGSVAVSAVATSVRGVVQFGQKKTTSLPPLANKHIFLKTLEKIIDPTATLIALNFAFPIHSTGVGEGVDMVLLRGTKEHVFEGVVGTPLAHMITEHLYTTRKQRLEVHIANDVVCLTLAGLGKSTWDSLVGAIVGTGMNIGFFSDQSTVINVESANFSRFTQTETGKRVDELSQVPGQHPFEKEVAGAYLYQHYNLVRPPLTSTQELDTRARAGDPLAQSLFARSASLCATQLVAVAHFRNTSQMTCVMEGSVFWKGWKYPEMVEKMVSELDPSLSISFQQIEHSNLLGAAYLLTPSLP